ncbi:methyl-accepting chemotaxis protein [Achromobacter seleniivolatilans]|uniref:Methyl-accepting chemotaxis protein n=1 Tax=Achromobacter seleniivolatilans TaxID=3047478 RepID=A0ABY9LU26_9BURK|nr:methyl-accepting chemotaxis protein [Achromobacter sp. R39]WMD18269.1 methyl-accepting chemotaxis protein [Achromobacter sp. R39]
MKNSSLRRELLWFVFAIGAAVLALGAWDAWERRADMVAERKTELRHVLDLAAGILRNGKQSAAEGMPLADAKRNVARRLAQLRYGADGYVGAFGDDYNLLVHPDAKLVGTNVRAIKDVDGLPIFEDLYAQGKGGGGYVQYRFPRPGEEEALPKISYATYDNEWGWLLFTGLYVDDVDAAFYGTLWRQGSVTLGLLALVLLAALRFFRTHVISPLDEAVALCERVANGDLSSVISRHHRGEIGRLFDGMARMQQRLDVAVRSIVHSTGSIAAASRQIAAGSMDLSDRTEKQAAALEQTAASVEQITATAKQSADHVREVSSLASQSAQLARQGSEETQHAIDAMGEISHSSQRIDEIISVIDGIAFQTNILALNAAVEAARAGEQGRGFAVVAGEVRALAQRSATAAKEIKGLIEASSDSVARGSQRVEQASATMSSVLESATTSAPLMGEIATASTEQSVGIEQINQAVTHLDSVTQQNAALVEEFAASAATLHEQADDLARAVSVFKLSVAG